MDKMKKQYTGYAYALRKDGCGGIMADHYHPDHGPVVNESFTIDDDGNWVSVPYKIPNFAPDDYSTPNTPGFTIPPEPTNNKTHPAPLYEPTECTNYLHYGGGYWNKGEKKNQKANPSEVAHKLNNPPKKQT